ncbi:MAG: serine/threonine protein kinase, partial [Flavobacteriales bacterium]
MGPRQQPAELPIGTLLAKRYTVVQKLGAGGFGAVYEADDALMNQRVAVKVMRTRGERDKQQFRAEVSLLRLLRLPNLVHLIDDGEFEGVQFLVTDVVRGARFPGLKRRPSWKDIEYTTLCLLESLARVHSYGVVHRDLKPSNVFVGADGEPTILDFGVSFGPGFRLDNSGRIVGTPAFLSPEQATGQPGDARSDLYALGVMVYEALSGRLPHTGDTLEQLLAAKINVPPVPLRNVAPHVPPGVAFAIDALLRTDVHLRPPNATIALELFGVPRNNLRLPWLGPREAIERAVALLVGGESFVTEGRSGLGHSRLLEEVAIAVEEAGGEAWVGGHAEYKWGSLPNELLERIERLPEVTDEDMVGLLRDAANDGVILLMDDAPLMDKQTRQAVHRSGIPTAWVSESADLPRVRLAPLSAEDVDVLFHGPELIVHLRSDAATLAVRLSEGRPRALSVQLDGWVKAGIGYWDHGKMRVTREALDRIDAGLDV